MGLPLGLTLVLGLYSWRFCFHRSQKMTFFKTYRDRVSP